MPAMNRFYELAEKTSIDSYGGAVPETVERLAIQAAEEVTTKLGRRLDPNTEMLIKNRVAEVAIKVAAAILHHERRRTGGDGWFQGFGKKNPMEAADVATTQATEALKEVS